ncbi:hypothetical protein [Vibrio stylophorae]|nr:hypothetical protein [Vibrio stylophorae]
MIEITDFSIEEHQGEYEDWPLESALFFNDCPLDFKVPGYVIDQQYKLDEYYLLIFSCDCLFEECCTLVVVSPSLKLLGQYRWGGAYQSYLWESLSQRDAHCFCIDFGQGLRYEITIRYPKRIWFQKVLKVKQLK